MTPKSRRLSDEERALWEKTASGVTPLERGETPPAPPAPLAPPAASAPAPKKPDRRRNKPKDFMVRARTRAEDAIAAAAQKSPPPDMAPDMTLDRRRRRALKIGKLPIEAKLDMHGLFRNQAKAALADFIEAAALSGKGAVLVITGKGDRKNGEPGVLRRMTPTWLKAEPTAQYIVGFSPAGHNHGGVGAFYVQLKKRARKNAKNAKSAKK
ncbi:MAG: Smr/MutS family protein [Rhodospirillales bacterium]